MESKRRIIPLSLVAVLTVVPAAAQFGMRTPGLRGLWNPVVGSGAAYQIERRDDPKMELEFAVVGSETVDGKTGYWLETVMKDKPDERMYVKQLIVLDGNQTRIKRVVMQADNQLPMEMPVEMMMRGGRAGEQHADVREQAERVGTESVTTPAGSFTCEHYRLKDGSGDVWITEKISPYGLVKMTGREANMTLLRVLSNAKTHITGTPQKFDPMEMMRRQMNKE